jgi:hypothetical protein
VDWTLLANLDFLADFFIGPRPDPTEPAIAEVLALVRQAPAISLRDVLRFVIDNGYGGRAGARNDR